MFGRDGDGSNLYRIRLGYHLLSYFNSNLTTDTDIFKNEYKTNISGSDFYFNYSIQLKMHIVKFNLHEYNFTTEFIVTKVKSKLKYTSNNFEYRSKLNYNG
jgi:hypothetical protein